MTICPLLSRRQIMTGTLHCFLLIVLAHAIFAGDKGDVSQIQQNDEFCEQTDDGLQCSEKRDIWLTRLDGGEEGSTRTVKIDGEKELELKTICTKPLIIEIPDFLTAEECAHLISVAKELGLESSQTHRHEGHQRFMLLDADGNKELDLEEMRRTIEGSYDVYLDEEDILQMYGDLKLDSNGDTIISQSEMASMTPLKLDIYLKKIIEAHPEKHSRYSQQVWLYPDSSTDHVFTAIQDRVRQVVKLPATIIKESDFQVVNYGAKGHYNAHWDSAKVDPKIPCCDKLRSSYCRICRYMTILFYLNDVEEGGETAFPSAKNDTITMEEISAEGKHNLYRKCSDVNLRVLPQRGKGVIWYNHLLDPDRHWMGEQDNHTLHGGCPVIRGEKWVANFWIKTTNNKDEDIKKFFSKLQHDEL